MLAMVLTASGAALRLERREDPIPVPGDVRVKVSTCGVCRTDLHVVDGELPGIACPIIPGHEVVGRVDALGAGVTGLDVGERAGVPWLGYTCRECSDRRRGRENLLSVANMTRHDGIEFLKIAARAGIATHTTVFPLREANEVLSKPRAGQITGAAVLQS
jgi:propanol-preferring alcohol dehydrogenase